MLTPEEREETDKVIWQCIGLQNRITKFEHEVMWPALVEHRKHVTIFADGELIGQLNFDYTKENPK